MELVKRPRLPGAVHDRDWIPPKVQAHLQRDIFTMPTTAEQIVSEPTPVTSLGKITTQKKAVIGIDLGTAFSGTSRVYTSDPTHVRSESLSSDSTGSVKEETVLLETTEQWYFGKAAIEKYNELKDTELRDYEATHHDASPLTGEEQLGRKGIHLYRFFKASLSKIEDRNFDRVMFKLSSGHEHSLMDLMARTLKFLGEFAFDKISTGFGAGLNIEKNDILWVVTVPAIWSDLAKLFMRKAAFRAGLIADESSDDLLISLEPECAALSVYVEASKHGLFADGSIFMVVDCGGGTVDITVHKVATQDPLVMDGICEPTGGMWGGMFVDCQFERFLKYLFGTDMYKRLERNWPMEVEEVKEKFRLLKQRFDPNETNKLHRLDLSPLMRSDIRSQQGLSKLIDLVQEFNLYYTDEIPFDFRNQQVKTRIKRDDTLVFTQEQMMRFFQPTVDNIVVCVDGMLQKIPGINYIVLVGGYGSSPVLGRMFRTKFESEPVNKTVIIPDSAVKPQAAIVYGAAHYGLCTAVVRSRIVAYTYGVSSSQTWFDGCGFTRDHAYWDDTLNEWRVDNMFSIIVRRGDEAKPGKPFQREEYAPVYDNQTEVTFKIFRSTGYSPRFVSDEGCELLGQVIIGCRNHDDTFKAMFTFAAEIRVEVVRCDGARQFKVINTNTM